MRTLNWFSITITTTSIPLRSSSYGATGRARTKIPKTLGSKTPVPSTNSQASRPQDPSLRDSETSRLLPQVPPRSPSTDYRLLIPRISPQRSLKARDGLLEAAKKQTGFRCSPICSTILENGIQAFKNLNGFFVFESHRDRWSFFRRSTMLKNPRTLERSSDLLR